MSHSIKANYACVSVSSSKFLGATVRFSSAMNRKLSRGGRKANREIKYEEPQSGWSFGDHCKKSGKIFETATFRRLIERAIRGSRFRQSGCQQVLIPAIMHVCLSHGFIIHSRRSYRFRLEPPCYCLVTIAWAFVPWRNWMAAQPTKCRSF